MQPLGIALVFSLSSSNTTVVRARPRRLARVRVHFDGLLVDLNMEDKNGWTPLHHAVKNNALNSMEFLLDNGVDDVRLNHQREAAIHVAVIHNQLNALKVRSSLDKVLLSLRACVSS